jgi:prophage regulatory protein
MRNTTGQTASATEPMPYYVRLNQIVRPKGYLPISRSTFYKWIQDGIAPAPIKLGSRVSIWRSDDIKALVPHMNGEV